MKNERCIGEFCIFVDYKSAYNTLNQKSLYDILKRKNILLPKEVDFLETLHDALYFEFDIWSYYLRKGVH